MPSAVEISGKVTLPNGSPAANVKIEFNPTTSKGGPGSATTDATGKYSVKLAPGQFSYFFAKPEGGKADSSYNNVPENYRKPSGNLVEVPSAGGNVDIQIK